jgi:hypothetical protein
VAATAVAEAPKMKMTTPIRPELTTPDKVKTSIGTLKFFDGSYIVYYAPKAPKGYENNWVETIPGKSWFVILRMYSPLKPWIDQTWRPGEVELVK